MVTRLLLATFIAIPLLWSGYGSAQQKLLVPDDQVRICEEHTVELIGSSIGLVENVGRYGIQTSIPQGEVVSIEHEIWQGEQFLESYTTSLFDLIKDNAGVYRIKTLIQTNNGCTYVSQFTVSLYDRIIVTIGQPLDEISLLSETVDEESTKIIQLTQDELTSQYGQTYLENTSTLLIDADALPLYLETVQDRMTIKRIYVISDLDLATYRKLIATHSTVTTLNEIVVIERDSVGSFFTDLLLRPDNDDLQVSSQVFEPGTSPGTAWSLMGVVIEYALQNGVSLQIIRFFLLIPVLALLMTLLRQVVGLTTYSIWYPLIIAWCGMTIGWTETGLLIASGALSVLVVGAMTKKIYLLSGAKTALIGGVYALFCIIGYYGVTRYDLATLDMIEGSMLLYVIMLLYVCMSIFRSPSMMRKGKWWIGIIQFIIVTLIVMLTLQSERLFDFLLTYPEVIILALIGIMIAGRFTGLQFTEYARFMPLISHLLEEEE